MKKRATIVLLAALLLSSCGMRHARAVMDDVETYLQEAPDSARVALQALPLRTHYFPWQHARYCLLLSSALDRSGVLVENDSLARYAADFYDHFGSPVKRFYSQYYLGRVHENRGDRQSAMEAYIKAENITSNKVPNRFRCALEMHMGAIYAHVYESQKAIQAFEKAAEYAEQCGWKDNQYQAVLNLVRVKMSQGEYEDAERDLASLSPAEPEMTTKTLLSKKGCEIRLMEKQGTPARDLVPFGDSIITRYREEVPSLIPWGDFSSAYVRSGAFEKAHELIQLYALYNDTEDNSVYYGLLSEVLDSLGDLRGSLGAYKRYLEISDSLDLTIFDQDIKFLKERYSFQEQATKRKTTAWLSLVVATLLFCAMLFFLVRRKKENVRLKSLYSDLQDEYKALQELPYKMDVISHEASSLLGNRIKALSSFFNKGTPSSLSLIATQLETLTQNRKELLETIGLLFAVYRPDFVLKLTEKGMTPAETGYCCLIALGMRTAEISKVINREGLFNISSALRRKLGLPQNSTKLGTVLKEMLGNSPIK